MTYTQGEKSEITTKLKAVAISIAELWDALRTVESRTGKEIEIGNDLFSNLAGGCSTPPTFTDLDDKQVWETFKEYAEVR